MQHATCRYEVGQRYLEHSYLEGAVEKGMAFLQRATDHGHADAGAKLGLCFVCGLVPRDEAKARMMWMEAAGPGSEIAKGYISEPSLNEPLNRKQARRNREATAELASPSLVQMNANTYSGALTCGSSACDRIELRDGPKFRRCASCKRIAYCSRDYQKVHWRESHRHECARAPISGSAGMSILQ